MINCLAAAAEGPILVKRSLALGGLGKPGGAVFCRRGFCCLLPAMRLNANDGDVRAGSAPLPTRSAVGFRVSVHRYSVVLPVGKSALRSRTSGRRSAVRAARRSARPSQSSVPT
jgi:hypothetical protein